MSAKDDDLRESISQRCEALGDALEGVLANGGINKLEAIILLKACDEIIEDIHQLPEEEWKE